jgi:hypothetical protein
MPFSQESNVQEARENGHLREGPRDNEYAEQRTSERLKCPPFSAAGVGDAIANIFTAIPIEASDLMGK